MKCACCWRPRVGIVFCRQCHRAFDRADIECTHAALIEWTAERVRKMVRQEAIALRAAKAKGAARVRHN